MGRSLFRTSVLAAAFAATVGGFVAGAVAETKSYVVNWFYMDNYFGGDEDCPKGLNPSSIDFYKREMARLG